MITKTVGGMHGQHPEEKGGKEEQFPPIPEPTWTPKRNLDEIRTILEKNYPSSWVAAKKEIKDIMNSKGITGILGLVTANIEKINRSETKKGESATALKKSTQQQIIIAIRRTTDFLQTDGTTPKEKAEVQSLIEYWKTRGKVDAPQAGGQSPADYELTRAGIIEGTWRDITVLHARHKAEQEREYVRQARLGLKLPEPKQKPK
jgi:hypothetical protein